MTRAFDKIKLDAEAVGSVDLAGDDEIRGHAMLDHRVCHQRCFAMDKAPFKWETGPAHSALKRFPHTLRVPLEKIPIGLKDLR